MPLPERRPGLMRFMARKRRSPPAVIIVSLIDVLMVVLIFLTISTTMKQQPAVKLTLPDSKEAKAGAAEKKPLTITVAKTSPYLFLENSPVTLEKLQQELIAHAAQNPEITVFIRADTDAPFGQIIKVMDAAKAANIRAISAFTKGEGQK